MTNHPWSDSSLVRPLRPVAGPTNVSSPVSDTDPCGRRSYSHVSTEGGQLCQCNTRPHPSSIARHRDRPTGARLQRRGHARSSGATPGRSPSHAPRNSRCCWSTVCARSVPLMSPSVPYLQLWAPLSDLDEIGQPPPTAKTRSPTSL
ncbi:hypothetical protein M6B38_105790 [Iris pallida]|uniref:Uncharacterized protein n=1 Tax=Iris pallida TaxID=29817 RepID=A0AAX6ESL9_IRIPA|nr:hypothetical protein M6B38_105790 [Iris pallida]